MDLTPVPEELRDEIRAAASEQAYRLLGVPEGSDPDLEDWLDHAVVLALRNLGYVVTDAPPVAVVHVAGPWEDAWNTDGDPIHEQRCLRCDAPLVEWLDVPGRRTVKKGWPVGAKIALVEQPQTRGRITYNADVARDEGRKYEEEDCRGFAHS